MKEKITLSVEKVTNEKLEEMAKITSKTKSEIVDYMVSDAHLWVLGGYYGRIEEEKKKSPKSNI